MNVAQKILTVIFLLLFAATLIWFPWTDPNPYAPERLRFYPIFTFPSLIPMLREAIIEWFSLAVIYAGLFFVLKNRRP